MYRCTDAQPRSIPLTAAGRKRRERESKCQNHPNEAEASTERKRRERVSKRKNFPVFGLDHFDYTRNKK
jgi:hypothetical protein